MAKLEILGITSILVLVIAMSGCTNYNTYNGSSISFGYPNGWYEAPGQGNVSVFDFSVPVIVTIGDNTNKETGVLVLSGNNVVSCNISTEAVKNEILKYGSLISESNLTKDNINLHEFVYNTTLHDGTVKKEKIILYEKNNNIFILIFTALPQDFDNQQANFQMIQNSFKVN